MGLHIRAPWVAGRRRSSRAVSYAVGNVGSDVILRVARATFRPVLRVARVTFRPFLRAARATFRPVLRATRPVLRAVLRATRPVLRAVLRTVRVALRPVVFFVAIVSSPSVSIRFTSCRLCRRTWQVKRFTDQLPPIVPGHGDWRTSRYPSRTQGGSRAMPLIEAAVFRFT